MSSLFSLLTVARDGMIAQQGGVGTTGVNVANVDTPGYVKRTARLETLAGTDGVQLAGIDRSFDRFIYGHVVSEEGKRGAATARGDALETVQSIVAPGGDGSIANKVSQLFTSLSALVGNPADPTARTVVLSRATDLAQTVSATATGLSVTRGELLSKAQGTASEINSRLATIATLNQQIASAQGIGGDTSSLRDQRDVLVRDVGERIGATSIEDKTGAITIFGGGTTLVDGNTAVTVGVDLDPSGAMTFSATRSSGSVVDISKGVQDGTLAGLREARDVDIPAASAQLDSIAYDLANAVNAVHSTGVGLDGATGRPLFTPPTSLAGAARSLAVDPSMVGRPDRIGASGSAADIPGGNDVAVKLAALAAKPLGTTGGSPSERIGALGADVGARKSSADSERSLRESTVAQAVSVQDSHSGVSLDEEMADLTKYQHAFDASVRVLQAADELLQGLLKL